MSKLNEAMESYIAFQEGRKLFADLETAAVYETSFHLQCPVSEVKLINDDGIVMGKYPGKTKEEAENWLNAKGNYTPENQSDTTEFAFMDTVVDSNGEYPDNIRIAVGNGLVKNFCYKFDDDQSGKLYVETTRQLTKREQTVLQDFLTDEHCPGLGYTNEGFSTFLGYTRTVDIFNVLDDAGQQTEFKLDEIPLKEYLNRTDDFATAIESLSTEEDGISL